MEEDGKRVLVIDVPSRPIGKLLKYEEVPLMRIGESLRPMSEAEMLSILKEQEPDYSAMICRGLTIDDLDTDAIAALKQRYASKQQNSNLSNESTAQLLNDLELTTSEGITYDTTSLLLRVSPVLNDCVRFFMVKSEQAHPLGDGKNPFTGGQK